MEDFVYGRNGSKPCATRGLAGFASPGFVHVWGDCGFPPEADVEQINFARVRVVVTVGPDGRAKSVAIQSDPGHGFGERARRCAIRRTYKPGLDRSGKPVTRTTPPIWIRFER